MRVLGPIIQPLVLAMLDPKAHLRLRCAVGTELVGDHDARRRNGGFQEPLHEPSRCLGVSSALDQDVENKAILIDGPPQPVLLAGDRHDEVSGAEEFRPRALSGRVGDWRAGLGRSSCSLLARSFVCECHTISTMPRFQPPPRRTQHADFLALRSPVCFASRHMGPILPGRLSALVVQPDSP
jgi:hypothetical protein